MAGFNAGGADVVHEVETNPTKKEEPLVGEKSKVNPMSKWPPPKSPPDRTNLGVIKGLNLEPMRAKTLQRIRAGRAAAGAAAAAAREDRSAGSATTDSRGEGADAAAVIDKPR